MVSGIAEDEFKPPFLPLKPTAEDRSMAACRVITDSTTTANISINGPGLIERLHKDDLHSIIPKSLVRVWPSTGFEINGQTGPIDLGTAGYWCFQPVAERKLHYRTRSSCLDGTLTAWMPKDINYY